MKAVFSIIIILNLVTNHVFSQKCKISNDPFTNEKTVTFDFKGRSVFYELKNDIIKFEMRFQYGGEQNVTFKKGRSIFFKLQNGKILELKTYLDSAPNTHLFSTQYSAAVYTTYSFVFNLSNTEVRELANSKVLIIRFPNTNGEYLDQELKGKRKKISKVILEGGQCMLSNL